MPVSAEQPSMNRSTDYLERVVVFDRLAAEEGNPEFKTMFEENAGAYRKIAGHRAKQSAWNSPKSQTETLPGMNSPPCLLRLVRASAASLSGIRVSIPCRYF